MQFHISFRREHRWRDSWIFKIRVLKKAFSKEFYFIRRRRQQLWSVEQRRYNRLTFAKSAISKLPKVSRAKFLKIDGLFCSISIRKFGSLKNLFVTINSLPTLYFGFRRFILFIQTKKVISMNYGSSASSWKPCWRVKPDLISTMRWDIYINSNLKPLKQSTGSMRTSYFKDIFPWNISQTVKKITPTHMRIVINYVMK